MTPTRPEKHEDLLCLNGRKLPDSAKSYDELFRYWRASAARQSGQTRDLVLLRRRLTYSLSTEFPSRILTEGCGENLVLGRAERRDRMPAWWRAGKGSPLLLVNSEGSAAARKEPAAQAALAAGRPVLLIDTFQTGAAKAVRDRSPRYFLTFNKSDDANRVQDILTALAFLQKQKDRAARRRRRSRVVSVRRGRRQSGLESPHRSRGISGSRPGLSGPILRPGRPARGRPRCGSSYHCRPPKVLSQL